VKKQCELEKADRIAINYYIDHCQHYNVSVKLGEKVVKRGIPFTKVPLSNLSECPIFVIFLRYTNSFWYAECSGFETGL